MKTNRLEVGLGALCSTILGGLLLLSLSGCAAGVIGAIIGASSGGGGGGGGAAAPAVAALTLTPSVSATSGTANQADPEARFAELAVVNLPDRYQIAVDDVVIDADDVDVVQSGGETSVRFPIPDHRFTFANGLPVAARDLRIRAQKVVVRLTDLDSGAQTRVDFIYLPPKVDEIAPNVVSLVGRGENGVGGVTLSEFVAAVAAAGGTDGLPEGLIRFDPELLGSSNLDLADEVGTILTIQGEYYDFDDPVSVGGSSVIAPNIARALERTKVLLNATENGVERVLGELPILQPISGDDVINVFVPASIVNGLSPDTQFGIEVQSPNGAPEKRTVFVAPPYPVEVPRKADGQEANCVVLEEDGSVTVRWANNCDGPPLVKDTSDVSVQLDGDYDPRYPRDGDGAASEAYPAGFTVTRREFGAPGGILVNDRDSTARIGERCADGIDNDADGLIDAADPDCQDDRGNFSPPETNCTDGRDNDDDGLTDERDSDCRATNAQQFTDTTAGELDPGFYCYDVVGRLFVGDLIRHTAAFQVVVPIFRPGETYDLVWDLTSDRSQGMQAKTALERLGRNVIVFEGREGLARALCGTNRDLASQLSSVTLLYGESIADDDTDGDEAVTTRPPPVLSREDVMFLRNEYLAGSGGERGRLWISGGNVFSSLYSTLSSATPTPGASTNLAFAQQVLGVRPLNDSDAVVARSAGLKIANSLTRVLVGPGEEDDVEKDDFTLELGVAAAEIACGDQSIEQLVFQESGRRDDLGVLDPQSGTGVIFFQASPGATSAQQPKTVTGVLNENEVFTGLVTTFSPQAFGESTADRVFRDCFRSLGIEFKEVCDNFTDDDCDGLEDADDPDCFVANVADQVSRVSMADGSMVAVLNARDAAPPPGEGPAVDVRGNFDAINGGTSQIRVSGEELAKVIVFVDGLAGFWEQTISDEGRRTRCRQRG